MKRKAYIAVLIAEIVIAVAAVSVFFYNLMHGTNVSSLMLPATGLIFAGFYAVEELIDTSKRKIHLAVLIAEMATIVALLSILSYNFMNGNDVEGLIILVVGLIIIGLITATKLIDIKKELN